MAFARPSGVFIPKCTWLAGDTLGHKAVANAGNASDAYALVQLFMIDHIAEFVEYLLQKYRVNRLLLFFSCPLKLHAIEPARGAQPCRLCLQPGS